MAVPQGDLLKERGNACYAPILGEPINGAAAERLARVLKALADPSRLRLISMVATGEDSGSCVCDLAEPLDLGQPTVSHHLKVLVDAGILSREKRGTWAYYRIVPGSLEGIASSLTAM